MLKRAINLFGSLLVAAFDKLSALKNRLIGRQPRGTCVVLAYHSVTQKQRAQFARQMDDLIHRAHPIRADVGSLPDTSRRYVAVTFDDGLENIIENALPELKRRQIPATLFIVTEALGKNPSWEYFGGDDPSRERAMTENQLRQLPSEYVAIGSHTMTHPVLPAVDDRRLTEELMGSRAKLETMLNREVKLFSFPYGAFDERVVERCREARYERVFTALPILAFTKPQEFVTGRVGATPSDWPIEFRLKLAGAYRWLPYAFALKRRLFSIVRKSEVVPFGPQPQQTR
jgi:peptidoglycan/xylan/chitin deacetylase (PgdA/CDA1 family)